MGRGPRIVALSVALALVGSSPAAADSLFSGPVSWPVGDAQDVVIANLNKDSIPDLATADNQPAQASVLLGTGNGALGTAVGLPLTGHPHEIRAADFNGDTNIDLAVSEQDTGNVAILLNAGDGTF